MMYELQKANMWKRISAALFDLILLVILCVGCAFTISALLDYDSYTAQMETIREEYAEEYGVSLKLSAEERAALPEEEQAKYAAAEEAFQKDEQIGRLYPMILNFTFIIVIFGVLIGYLLLELAVPLMLGNGQTLGKKVFGVGVMRIDGVKISPLLLVTRTILGKYTVETMIPILILLMMFFGAMDFMMGLVVIGLIWVVQLVLVAANQTRTPIHDKLAQTVTVDIASQKIFDNVEALKEYQAKKRAESRDKTYG